MTSSPRSGSEAAARPPRQPGSQPPSRAYELYHPKVQRWIYERGWDRLRDAQERAAGLIIEGTRDVIIASATASGKTEAVLLALCSAVARPHERGAALGLGALCVRPLEAAVHH